MSYVEMQPSDSAEATAIACAFQIMWQTPTREADVAKGPEHARVRAELIGDLANIILTRARAGGAAKQPVE